jgi:hypothetical protein
MGHDDDQSDQSSRDDAREDEELSSKDDSTPLPGNPPSSIQKSRKEVMESFWATHKYLPFTKKGMDDFNKDTFRVMSKDHMRRHDMKNHGVSPLGGGWRGNSKKPQKIELVPTFKDCYWLVNPNDHREIYTVRNKDHKDEMLRRGYLDDVVKVYHCGTLNTLPASIKKRRKNPEVVEERPLENRPRPTWIRIPDTTDEGYKAGKPIMYPNLYCIKGETLAEAVVRAVEDKVIDKIQNQIWSPYHLWTQANREGTAFATCKDTKPTKWFSCYYYIRMKLCDEGEGDPSKIKTKMNKMHEVASKHYKEQQAAHSDTESNSKGHWFLEMLRLHNEHLSANDTTSNEQ